MTLNMYIKIEKNRLKLWSFFFNSRLYVFRAVLDSEKN